MRNSKRRTILLIVIMLFFQCFNLNLLFDSNADIVSAEESGQHLVEVPDGFVGIYSISDLNRVRDNLSGKYILMNDLDLSVATSEGGDFYNVGAGWNPIGSEATPFTGVFDGNGFKIIGMKVHLITDQKAYAGLFGYVKGAAISNLGMDSSLITVDNQSLDSATSIAYAGGIVGYAKDLTITNSYNTGDIQTTSLFNETYAGGLIGYLDSSYNKTSTVTNSYNTGDINSKAYSGGIAGKIYRTNLTNIDNSGDINLASNISRYVGGIVGYGSYANITGSSNSGSIEYVDNGGGIAGYLSNSKIDSSYNNGDLTGAVSFSTAGGIVGSISTSSSISNSYNKGKISSNADYSDGGGIAGTLSSNSSIMKSYNQGDITVDSSAGGIVGELFSSIIVQAYNSGKIYGFWSGGINGYASGGTVKNAFNIGGIGADYCSGGIAGKASNLTIQNSYNISMVSHSYWNGSSGAIAGEFAGTLINNYYLDNMYKGVGAGIEEGTMKKSFPEMTSPETFTGFDFATIWTTGQNYQFHFPELTGMELGGQEKAVKITMKSLPEKTVYIQGEELDVTGASITVLTNYGNVMDKTVTREMVGSYYKDDVGTQSLIVTYEGVKTSFTVTVEKDVTPPEKPIVNEVTDFSTNVQGKAEPGSTIWIKRSSTGTTIGKGTASADGTFDIPISVQPSGRLLLIQAVDKYYNWSEAAEVWVKDTIPPAKPIVNKVTDQSITITGSAEGSSFVYAKVGDQEWITVSDQYGNFKIDIPKLKGGTVIEVWVCDSSWNESEKVNVTVVPVSAPTNFKAVSSTYNSAKLTWTAVSGASGYEIYRATSSTGTYTKIATTTSTSYLNTGLDTGKTYYYKVRAYSTGTSTNYTSFSSVVSVKPVLLTPISVKATSLSYNSIKTSWAAVSGANGYEVFRATSSTGTYSLIGTTTSTSFNNGGLTTNKLYFYKVRAYRTVGSTKVYSNYSSIVSVKPIPSVPTNFKATRVSSTSLKLTWSSVTCASGYEIYRATSSTGTYSLLKSTTSLYYNNSSLTTGRTYYYKLRAYRTVGTTKVYSGWTTVISAKP
ncbi:Ig-like domain-containing protein [Neobacillus sp. LXY-4]|uniref:Ig-like domain-containing protein n=1 Tax=Neobacillus sp. LXY-4 TaxID=3379826 RepID=UPI003EE34996